MRRRQRLPSSARLIALLALATIATSPAPAADTSISPAIVRRPVVRPVVQVQPAIVFVSRQIGTSGSIYYAPARDMPGIGPHSRFDVAAPGRLLVREPGGSLRTLIDGATPTAATLNLIDVNAPDVSYDGRRIVFAGLPATARNARFGPEGYAGAWRLYVINVDGTGLRQVTTEEAGRLEALRARNIAAPDALARFDDGDPAWLPDGSIVFSSTRYPEFGHYSGVRASNLYIVQADGSGLRRLTAERNGADRPMVDPLTGQIVFARWWRNHRFPVDSEATIADANGGFVQKDGLTANRGSTSPNAEEMFRNAWHAAAINPDGTGLAMWTGHARSDADNHVYGGTFLASGDLIANFFPMYNMTEAGGFGGLRRYQRGPGTYTRVIGITEVTGDQSRFVAPNSFGIYKLAANDYYASEPAALPDGRLVVSLARDINQDYGLYAMNADGSGVTPLFDVGGTSELRAKPIVTRRLPPVLPAASVPAPSMWPPTGTNYAQDGTFTFNALNVYFNAPVDTDIVSAPAVGSAASIRFFIDHQRQSPGSFPNLDWPILLGEKIISPAGRVVDPAAPAHVPLFEQLRSANRQVPLTGGPDPDGSAHVAGLNFGQRGQTASCVGCHAGHTMIPVPATDEGIEFTNLAPGATITVSSTRDAGANDGLIDRRVQRGEIWRYWTSASGQVSGQWVRLAFAVPVTVKTVRLYNPRPGDVANSSIAVNRATVELCIDVACTQIAASNSIASLSVAGTDVPFAKVRARAVRVRIDDVSGTFYGMRVASLAEIEVIARGEAP